MAKSLALRKKGKAKDQSRHKYSVMRRHLTMAAQASGDTLRPWMKEAAIWYVGQIKPPTLKELQQHILSYTKQKVSTAGVAKLMSNDTWLAYLTRLDEEVTTFARAKAENKLAQVVDWHFEAIEDLNQTKDWGTMVKYTNPLLERIWPKDQGTVQTAQIIQILVGQPGSFAANHADGQHEIVVAEVTEVV